MDADNLRDLVKRYEENRQFITNEETAKMALVAPFVRHLGYDPNNPREVRLEFCAEFAQCDGKKLPDRMDFAIFDQSGQKPLMVIETKPLGTNLQANSYQLARYVSQLPDLHFGIITDGCRYLFFGDLESPNCMDKEPFFAFALDDVNTDWTKVAKFLNKFSRESFNADTLITDAEDSRYRQAMIDKLAAALKNPAEDEGFMKWLTLDVYKGKRTDNVMKRLANIAKDSVEPAMVRLMSGEFLEKLRDRMDRLQEVEAPKETKLAEPTGVPIELPDDDGKKSGIETTSEELEFHKVVKDICVQAGYAPDDILWRDTTNYFNVSFKRPTKWFVRLFARTGKRSIITYVTVETARKLAPGFTVEEAPPVFGTSRIYIDSTPQTWAIKDLILESLRMMQTGAGTADADAGGTTVGQV